MAVKLTRPGNRRYYPIPLTRPHRSVFALVPLLLLGLTPYNAAAQPTAVGYGNTELPVGYSLIANPLSAGQNQVSEVFRSPPAGAQIIKPYGGNWWTNEFDGSSWLFPEMTLSPGEGALVYTPSPWRQTWVGSIPVGDLKVFIPRGFSVRGSMVPQTGKLTSTLLFPQIAGTRIYKIDAAGGLVLQATCGEQGWEPSEPTVATAEAFYVEAPHDFIWSRSFANPFGNPDPTISLVVHPQSQQIRLGDAISLSVEASSAYTLSYQWQLNGDDVPGASGANLEIPNAGAAELGSYWVKVWDERTWAWSEVAKVELRPPSMAIQLNNKSDGVQLSAQEVAGRDVTVEYSSDLRHWVELSGPQKQSAGSLVDASVGNQTMRFYRLRVD